MDCKMYFIFSLFWHRWIFWFWLCNNYFQSGWQNWLICSLFWHRWFFGLIADHLLSLDTFSFFRGDSALHFFPSKIFSFSMSATFRGCNMNFHIIKNIFFLVDYSMTKKTFAFPKKHNMPFYYVSASDGTNVVKVSANTY